MLKVKECRHFTGMQEDSCAAGVKYETVIDRHSPREPYGKTCEIPCLSCGSHLPCDKREYPTAEEAKADEDRLNKEVAAYLVKHIAFTTRETEDCPDCGQHVDQLRQVGRCVYAAPCGCRIGQMRVPDAWKA